MPDNNTRTQSNTGVAVVGVTAGVLYAVFGVVHHRVVDGLTGLAIMLAFVGVFHGLRRRSEAAQLLVADPSDERQAQIMRNASAAMGHALVGVLTVWWLVAIATEADYLPVLTSLMAVGGFTFMGAVFWYSRRG